MTLGDIRVATLVLDGIQIILNEIAMRDFKSCHHNSTLCFDQVHQTKSIHNIVGQIEEYSAKRGLSPIWFISRKMAKQDFVYHCWQWLAATLKWLLHMLWISHHYETFTECRNEDSVAKIDTNSIFVIWGLNLLLALYSSILRKTCVTRWKFNANWILIWCWKHVWNVLTCTQSIIFKGVLTLGRQNTDAIRIRLWLIIF